MVSGAHKCSTRHNNLISAVLVYNLKSGTLAPVSGHTLTVPLKIPNGNFGIFAIVPKGKGASVWMWGMPGNDRHSL